MNSYKTRSTTIGVLFIAAAVFAILGVLSYGPILNNPDYITQGPTQQTQIVLGAVFELLTAAAVAGTALAFYPVLRKRNESIALGYVAFRILEAALIIVGLISMLTLLTVRQEVAGGAAFDATSILVADSLLRSINAWTTILGPNFMLGINTALYTYVLYRTRLVPRLLTFLGFTGAALVFLAALLELFGVILQFSVWGAALALPVFAYEMSLAVWLIGKGFDDSAVKSLDTDGPPRAAAAE